MTSNDVSDTGVSRATQSIPDQSSAPTASFTVNVYVKTERVYSTELSGKLELGRQRPGEEGPYARTGKRLVIARLEENKISRQHVLLEVSSEQVRLTNQSQVNTVLLGSDGVVGPGESRLVVPPLLLRLADRAIQIEARPTEGPAGVLESFSHQTIPPGELASTGSLADLLSVRRSSDETEYLLRGFHATIGLFQLAGNSADFFSMAARAMIDIVGLEVAAALTWHDGEWNAESICERQAASSDGLSEWVPSRTILQQVREKRRTYWEVPGVEHTASLMDVKALVAAPILNRKAEVIGALYGDRRCSPTGEIDLGITEIEAILVELLSTNVAGGLARLEQEQAAVSARVLFEQFFTPELTKQLEVQPDLLQGRDMEVTLLICNVRRFSEVSEQLGARLTLDWINDVMGTLSGCVADQQGVLVDNLGDELVGMWGAPVAHANHAELACQAAVQMYHELPALNRRWQDVLRLPINLGIGIHAGGKHRIDSQIQVRPVGNGSPRRQPSRSSHFTVDGQHCYYCRN